MAQMPARLLSMEITDPLTPITQDATTRRKSGRAIQKPVLYQQDPNVTIKSNGSGKRKRAEPIQVDESMGEETDSDGNESSPDEEELKEQIRRSSKAKKPKRKPAAKKPKTAEIKATTLAIRPATNGVKKPSKPKKSRAKQTPVDDESKETGLYAEIFHQGRSTTEIAEQWITQYNEQKAEAMSGLVNLVLKCTGCDLQVDAHDIDDPDNVTSKLTDLQDEFQAQKITDYPLISKARGGAFSRSTMIDFVASIIEKAHENGVLYEDPMFLETIQTWVTTMSSSSIRPFRHTATVVALSLATSICVIMKGILEQTASTMRQKESERKKKSVNKGRVSILQKQVNEIEKKREQAEGWLKDIFDTVFIHRYRDVDPKVRVDCTAALGTWISTCPDMFFEGQYLRYIGWVLSDTSTPTRAEALKQLHKLYKDPENAGRLRAFTERFRPRMVEMATQDADPAIRASAIDLLDLVREFGFLAPDDIDSIGRLIFDSESRVRKAVANFFGKSINDIFESTVEELGGDEALDEALGEEVEDDYDNPRQIWLKLKCLAEVLQSYDIETGEESPPTLAEVIGQEAPISLDSRYAIAARAICEGVPEAKKWEAMAGYLLYDHSSTLEGDNTKDPQAVFKIRCQLNDKEERLLLEVLTTAVKLRLTEAIEGETDKKGKRSKVRTDDSRKIQESTAIHLAQILPRLLRKFGASPITASVVLRLEQVLNLEIFQELRQDSTEYASLLDDISKQFLTHADKNVLKEASAALTHGRTFEDLEEVTESKMQELWDDTVGTLRQLRRMRTPHLSNLANAVHRIANLTSVSDCVQVFEAVPSGLKKGELRTLEDHLIDMMNTYGVLGPGDSDEIDLISTSAMKALLFYYMWLVRSLRADIDNKQPISNIPSYSRFTLALTNLIEAKDSLSDVRFNAISTLLDLHTLFATFRHLTPPNPSKPLDLSSLILSVPAPAIPHILSSFLAAEKAFATKSHRTLEDPADDDPPEADLVSEPEDDDDEDEEGLDDDERLRRSHRRQHDILLAEKRLCEIAGKIVLAIVARVLDPDGSEKGQLRRRLVRNRTRLGPNFKEVLAYLDEPKGKRSHKTKAVGEKVEEGAKSKMVVEEGEDEEEDEAVEDGGEEDIRRRELEDKSPEAEATGREEVEKEVEREDDDVMGD